MDGNGIVVLQSRMEQRTRPTSICVDLPLDVSVTEIMYVINENNWYTFIKIKGRRTRPSNRENKLTINLSQKCSERNGGPWAFPTFLLFDQLPIVAAIFISPLAQPLIHTFLWVLLLIVMKTTSLMTTYPITWYSVAKNSITLVRFMILFDYSHSYTYHTVGRCMGQRYECKRTKQIVSSNKQLQDCYPVESFHECDNDVPSRLPRLESWCSLCLALNKFFLLVDRCLDACRFYCLFGVN
jgi:hypothetical protein